MPVQWGQNRTEDYIDFQVYDLYDEYCNTKMTLRDFINKSSALIVASRSALVMGEALLPEYAEAQMSCLMLPRQASFYIPTTSILQIYRIADFENRSWQLISCLLLSEEHRVEP